MIQQSLWQEPVGGIIPRDYQVEDVANSFRLWDSGEVGVLTRAATGMGKTIMSCLKFRRWLDAGADYRCMVLSYERELVQQFTEEVRDVLGDVSIGIEMGDMSIDASSIPQIVVASRQTLMTHELATLEQRDVLKELGIPDVRLLTKREATRAILDLRSGIDLQSVADAIDEFNASERCNHELGRVSRLYKFDNRFNWLLVMDEAHKYSMQLKTVGHIIEWFEKNPNHRRSGITATPKRRDKVSIGTKLFPGVSIDFPLTRAVEQGYAVPYVQKFVQVESVDFKAIKEIAGKSQEKWDNEVNRRIEKDLAKLCDPLLDMVGDRSTLIFSPTVDLAAKVCDYINARNECECSSCGERTWHPKSRISDGAKCPKCSDWLESKHITKGGMQAYSISGSVPHRERQQVYIGHKTGKFQFLSVCGLCREGYNDTNISCVAVFRPVSKDASSLAEQMKGRGARPLKGTIHGMNTAEERLAAIAASAKPDCIAEGTPILTDHGEVPIELVTTDMKVWDGVEFVAHCGIIDRGVQRVITYSGLTATPDHKVWLHDETNPTSTTEVRSSFGDAAAKQAAIRVTGIGGKEVREADRSYRRGYSARQVESSVPIGGMPWVREAVSEELHGGGAVLGGLPCMRTEAACSEMAISEMSIGPAAMHESQRLRLLSVRRARHQVSVLVANGDGYLGAGTSWPASGPSDRSERKRRALCTRESTLLNGNGKLCQYADSKVGQRSGWLPEGVSDSEVFGISSKEATFKGIDMEGDCGSVQTARVYDILNAGPRHRFTAAGLLVSNCLIVDLVGITGLADCASTIQIYADGVADDIVARAEEIALEGGVEDPMEALRQAKREDEEAKERKRQAAIEAEELRRKRAEERARLDAKATYTTHDVGTASRDKSEASDKMIKFLSFLGMDFINWEPSRAQASRMIGLLQKGDTPDHVAYVSGLESHEWMKSRPSIKQLRKLQSLGYHSSPNMTPKEASDIIDALLNGKPAPKGASFYRQQIQSAKTNDDLTLIARSLHQDLKSGKIDQGMFSGLVEAGKRRRAELGDGNA